MRPAAVSTLSIVSVYRRDCCWRGGGGERGPYRAWLTGVTLAGSTCIRSQTGYWWSVRDWPTSSVKSHRVGPENRSNGGNERTEWAWAGQQTIRSPLVDTVTEPVSQMAVRPSRRTLTQWKRSLFSTIKARALHVAKRQGAKSAGTCTGGYRGCIDNVICLFGCHFEFPMLRYMCGWYLLMRLLKAPCKQFYWYLSVCHGNFAWWHRQKCL